MSGGTGTTPGSSLCPFGINGTLCACGDPFANHPTVECSNPHAPGEFDPFGHARRVAAQFTPGTVAHRVALYHDHIEDDLGPVPADIVAHVAILTRGKDEAYIDYIERVRASKDDIAIRVKLADARDNLARCGGQHDGKVNPSLARRYEYVIEALS